MKKRILYIFFALGALFYAACSGSNESETVKSYGPYGWLSGTDAERWDMVAEQFAGFSASMMEIQYRYQELYWAGMDENWEYALHHLEHIEEALEAGLQRRPKRKESAHAFLTSYIPNMEKVLEEENKEAFPQAFEVFRVGCNACHAQEKMAFIHVEIPTQRTTTVRLPR